MARVYYALQGGGAYSVEAGAFGQKALDAIFGDGSDGSITDSSNTTRSNQTLYTTNYTVDSGTTVDCFGTLIIHAQEYIEVNGTIHAKSSEAGGNGAGRTFGTGNPGDNGPDGRYIGGTGAGGQGGTGNGGDGSFASGAGAGGQGAFGGGEPGGDGGSGTGTYDSIPSATTGSTVEGGSLLDGRSGWDEFFNHPSDPAGGGAGGGSGGEDEGGSNAGRAGGDGGRGGGLVLLVAPEIRGTGTISADGLNGQNGEDGVASGGNQPGGGGGGGGGCGGLVYTVYGESFDNNLTRTAAGGSGGAGGTNTENGHDGGAGANGANGNIYDITVT